MKTFFKLAVCALLLSTINFALPTLHAQGTTFTYQGRLNNTNGPAAGNYDLGFVVCSGATGVNFVSGIITNTATPVSNGLFTVTLDFGPGIFDGSARWLALFVRTNGNGAFSPLLPRQALTATPYAVMSGSASNLNGTLPMAQLSGTLATTQLPANVVTNNASGLTLSGAFSGNGAGMTNLNAAQIISGTLPLAQLSGLTSNQWDVATWQLATNRNGGLAALATNVVGGIRVTNAFITNSTFAGNGAGLTNVNAAWLNGLAASNFLTLNGGSISAGQFIGSTNNVPLEFRVSNLRVFRIELGASGAPNIIAGAPNNYVMTGVVGATISGGGATNYAGHVWSNAVSANLGTVSGGASNSVSGTYGVVGGGLGNVADGAASVVAGGDFNTATGDEAFIGGGFNNAAVGSSAVVAGGNNNLATNASATVSGGDHNTASGIQASVAGGFNNTAIGNHSAVSGGYHNAASGLDSAIAGGRDNTNAGNYSSIGGGLGNALSGAYAGIGGGRNNSVSASDATIAGGRQNSVTNDYGFIGGGFGNLAGGTSSTVGGGNGNSSIGILATIGGGSANVASGFVSTVAGGDHNTSTGFYTTVGGGASNAVSGQYSTVGGGFNNVAAGIYAVVGGGSGNSAGSNYSVILGGIGNAATGTAASVGGGYSNRVSGAYSAVGGGSGNLATNTYAVIAGGLDNAASGSTASVGGGQNNLAAALAATVAGGFGNTIASGSDYSVISGGYNNVISNAFTATISGGSAHYIGTNADWSSIGGGRNHTITEIGHYATIPGGRANTATNYGFAAGYNAQAIHTGAFVWSDGAGTATTSAANYSVTMRARGGYRLFTSNGNVGASLDSGDTAWGVISDRNVKKDFAAINAVDILEKLSALPITQWHYNWEAAETTPHIGPMAQDFKAAFYPGSDDKRITTLEADGVAFAAIQGLNQKLEATRAENAELKNRLERLEKLLIQTTK